MLTKPKTPRPLPPSALPAIAALPAQLPIGDGHDVQVTLQGTDPAAVEAATAEPKARLGPCFAVLKRRIAGKRPALRLSASILLRPDDALKGGLRTRSEPSSSGAPSAASIRRASHSQRVRISRFSVTGAGRSCPS